MDIEWEDPPEVALLRSTGPGKYVEFAVALRDHPGRWAVLPNYEGHTRTEKGAKATAQNIKRGKVKGMPAGQYETAVQDGKVWVRYSPPAAGEVAQEDAPPPAAKAAKPAVDESKVDPAKVRAWARKQGLGVPDRGRLPDDVLDRYAAALERGEVGLPMRVVRGDAG